MRLAIVSVYLFDTTVGGVENHIRFMAKELRQRGHEIAVMKPAWRETIHIPVEVIDDIEVHHIDIGKRPVNFGKRSGDSWAGHAWALGEKLAFTAGAFHLARATAKWSPDIVWQHDFFSSWLASLLLSRRIPAVLTNHQGQYLFLQRSAAGRLLAKALLSHYRAVIGPSAELTPAGANSRTIYNGVDTDCFHPLPAEKKIQLRSQLFGAEANRFVVFCPRRWAPNKGVLYFARALARFKESHPGAAPLAVFAGNDGASYEQYRQEIHRALDGIDAKKLFLGDLDVYGMRDYYQVSDLVVIPSLLEAVSLSALEAMACETPVLATNVGGMPELIDTQQPNGYLVEPKSEDALFRAIQACMADENRTRIGKAAREHVLRHFRWSEIATQTEAVLESVLSLEPEYVAR